MGWEALIPLIAQVGLPLAERIWQKWQSGKDVTQADWDELKTIEGMTAQYHLDQIINRLGLDKNDPHVAAIAALIK